MIWILIAFVLILVGIYFWVFLKLARHIPETYPNAENREQIDHSKKVVVCFGDSNTHGIVSHNWVNDLAAKYTNFQFFNAGINADLTYTLLRRIDDVIACQPDFITILIGTNDVNSTMDLKAKERYQERKKIDKNITPNFAEFQANLTKILETLKAKTKAKIALMSLPIMGEDLSHEANLRADKYSEYIMQLADNEQVSYLPLREMQKDYLQKKPQKLKHTFEETYKLLSISVLLHEVLGWSFDRVTKLHGYQLTPDNLHQNSISGRMISGLVSSFLEEKNKA
jgi:lysophospholipase L1-like esterase